MYPSMKIVILNLTLLHLLLFLNCEGCVDEEREALLQIKNSINSPGGNAFSNWYGEDCCYWEGVECAVSTSLVVKLFFQYRRSEQSSEEKWFPNATLFAQFKALQELHLSGNQIAGFTSPNALYELKHLQMLDLRDNSIANVSHLRWGNMHALQFLDLSKNKLVGDIPKCLCESQSLTELDLSHNLLKGNIDACFSNMTSLQHLHLSDNLFAGNFPSLLFHNLTNIESFIISGNNFTDVISLFIFANLSKLGHLDISYNHDLEIETESPTWSPSFNLNQLNLGGCNLNKKSGKNIPTFISTQYQLESLDLSYNSLVGSIPSWLFHNVTLEVWLGDNNFSGFLPIIQRNMSSQLVALDIANNNMQGPFPADMINLIFPELHHLNASMNNFNGSLSKSLGQMKQLQVLDLSNNAFNGEIPRGMMSNMTSLEYLKLSNNYLKGEAIPNNFSWPKLKWLYLDRNDFSGLFPDNLSKCSSLVIISIHGNNFSGELSKSLPVFPQLRVLILGGNHFRGRFPLQLCQMKRLQILDLSENGLSGYIPTCLNNITSWTERSNFRRDFQSNSWVAAVDLRLKGKVLRYDRILSLVYAMDISSNKLTGTIPIQMSELRGILALNMSNNLLTGQIPASLSNLTKLESLDLSCNKLLGALPPTLGDLTFLSHMNVSYNNLSGRIPSRTQIQAFDSSSFIGNPGLCGPPLSKSCSNDPYVEERPSNLCSNMATSTSVVILWCTFFLVF